MDRREFVCSAVAAGVSAMLPTRSASAAEKVAFPLPEGVRFAGMAGAYSAMYTPFRSEERRVGKEC